MTAYIDGLRVARSTQPQAFFVGKRNGHCWCHLTADTLDELHAFAESIGLKRAWCHNGNHYDLTPPRRDAAIARGAVEVDVRTMAKLAAKLREAA